jgi:hypothetical protein
MGIAGIARHRIPLGQRRGMKPGIGLDKGKPLAVTFLGTFDAAAPGGQQRQRHAAFAIEQPEFKRVEKGKGKAGRVSSAAMMSPRPAG